MSIFRDERPFVLRQKYLFLILLLYSFLIIPIFRSDQVRGSLGRFSLRPASIGLRVGAMVFIAVKLLHSKREKFIDCIADSGRKCGPGTFVGPGPY